MSVVATNMSTLADFIFILILLNDILTYLLTYLLTHSMVQSPF